MNREQIIFKIKTSIIKEDPNAEIFLYGSRARGDDHKKSDWDILILVDKERVTDKIEDKFRDPLYNIELDSGQIISAMIYPKDYWNNFLKFSPLYNNVKREGIRL